MHLKHGPIEGVRGENMSLSDGKTIFMSILAQIGRAQDEKKFH